MYLPGFLRLWCVNCDNTRKCTYPVFYVCGVFDVWSVLEESVVRIQYSEQNTADTGVRLAAFTTVVICVH